MKRGWRRKEQQEMILGRERERFPQRQGAQENKVAVWLLPALAWGPLATHQLSALPRPISPRKGMLIGLTAGMRSRRDHSMCSRPEPIPASIDVRCYYTNNKDVPQSSAGPLSALDVT